MSVNWSGWIGVDLDGCLAHYTSWLDGEVGEPIPAMLERVKRWLAEGREVRIVTARVGLCEGRSEESQRVADAEFEAEQRAIIEAWCEKHVGQKVPITASKDFRMIELWDDRVVPVEKNTGRILIPDFCET